MRTSDEPIRTLVWPSMQPIRFPNVTHFRLDVGFFVGLSQEFHNSVRQRLALLEFDHLKSFTFAQGVTAIPGIVDFIVRYRELTSLHLEAMPLSYAEMRRFIDELPQLREISFDCQMGEQLLDVRRIMNETNDLQRISIFVGKFEQRTEYQEMNSQSINGWTKSSEKFGFNGQSWVRCVTFERL